MDLIPVEDSEVGIANRQVPVAFLRHVKHETVSRTVHGLEAILAVFSLNEEHVFLVFEVVATDLPQLGVKQVG